MKRWSVVAMDTPLVAAAKRVTTLVNAGAFSKSTTSDLRLILGALVGVMMPSAWPATAKLASGGAMRAKTARRSQATAKLSVVGSLKAKPLSMGATHRLSAGTSSYRLDVANQLTTQTVVVVPPPVGVTVKLTKRGGTGHLLDDRGNFLAAVVK